MSVAGDVTMVTLGTDWSGGRWLAGLALWHSIGQGTWTADDGEGESSLTGVFPYADYGAGARLLLWGMAGHGTGEVKLRTPQDEWLRADIALTMAATGVRSELVPRAGNEGPALALKTEGLFARTTLERARGINASEADVIAPIPRSYPAYRYMRDADGNGMVCE